MIHKCSVHVQYKIGIPVLLKHTDLSKRTGLYIV